MSTSMAISEPRHSASTSQALDILLATAAFELTCETHEDPQVAYFAQPYQRQRETEGSEGFVYKNLVQTILPPGPEASSARTGLPGMLQPSPGGCFINNRSAKRVSGDRAREEAVRCGF